MRRRHCCAGCDLRAAGCIQTDAMPQFDPYRLWLGIPPEDQPPNHYRLLGLSAFEADADVIVDAVERQVRHISHYKQSDHAEEVRKLLGELQVAEAVLLSPNRKAAYDQALRSKLGRAPTAAPPPAPPIGAPAAARRVPVRQPAAIPAESQPVTAAAIGPLEDLTGGMDASRRTRRTSKSDGKRSHAPLWTRPVVLLALAACLLGLAGAGYWFSAGGDPPRSAAQSTGTAEISNPSPIEATVKPASAAGDAPTAANPPAPQPADSFQLAGSESDTAWLDLLPLARKEQAVSGKWSIDARGLRGSPNDQQDHYRLLLPVIPPGEYELEVLAARAEGAEIDFGLPSGGTHTVLVVDGYGNQCTCAYSIDGKDGSKDRSAVRPAALTPNRVTRLNLIVRKAGVALNRDGQRVFTWGDGFARLGTGSIFAVPDPRRLFVGGYGKPMTIRQMRLRSLSGEAPQIVSTPQVVSNDRPAAQPQVERQPGPESESAGGPNDSSTATSPPKNPPPNPPTNPSATGAPATNPPAGNPALAPPQPPIVSPPIAPPRPANSQPAAEFTLLKEVPITGDHVAFSPDGQWVASAANGNRETVKLVSVRTGKETVLFDGQHSFIRDLAFAGNSKQLSMVDAEGAVTVWDVAGGSQLRIVPAPGRLHGRTFGPDARSVVLETLDNLNGTVVLVDTQSGTEQLRIGSPFQVLVLSVPGPTGRYLLLGGYDFQNNVGGPQRLTLYDLRTQRECGSPPESPPGQFWQATFSPDGARLALVTPAQPDQVSIWNVSGKLVERVIRIKSPTGGAGRVWAMTFTGDARQLVTVGGDNTFCVWDIASGDLRASQRYQSNSGFVFLRFASDGKTLCAANSTGVAQVWRIRLSRPKVAAPVPRLDPPSRESHAAALRLVKDAFSTEYAQAKKPADKAELARKLLARTSEPGNSAERYVLLEQARDLAAQGGDAALFCRALDTLSSSFAVDAVPLANAGLEQLPRGMPATAQADLAEGLSAIAERCAARGDWDAAVKLAGHALAAARKGKNQELAKTIARQQSEWKDKLRSAETLRADQATLEKNPDDPAANLSVGKLYGQQGDWARALPLLAKSSEDALRRLAADELGAKAEPAEQLRLADAWYDFAKAQSRKDQQLFLNHAAELYRQAAPGLKGLQRTKAQRRIDEFDAAAASAASE
jgi:WD40 repeat protein